MIGLLGWINLHITTRVYCACVSFFFFWIVLRKSFFAELRTMQARCSLQLLIIHSQNVWENAPTRVLCKDVGAVVRVRSSMCVHLRRTQEASFINY